MIQWRFRGGEWEGRAVVEADGMLPALAAPRFVLLLVPPPTTGGRCSAGREQHPSFLPDAYMGASSRGLA
ncbi:hypothetical protein O9K51_04522 [Purpureocillium lavendulum]|uniref:Uncharacterized protein n=1 Tax=Purpureocillium lavendulum TaxID=1247861 RepID=A0AB34FX05_9HYPO|nr:hypothetical protein O9K51_04522 [Purpureocillium lavendulum]